MYSGAFVITNQNFNEYNQSDTAIIYKFVKNRFDLPSGLIDHQSTPAINSDENKQQFGDLISNIALTLAKKLEKNPRAIAQDIVTSFKDPYIDRLEIAGPGFINIYLNNKAFDQIAKEMCREKDNYFKPSHIDHKKINIEFVSANPTGPLHFGHGRGGIIGDVLANVFAFLGYDVTREFYINDAGVQMQKLGESLKARYAQLAGLDTPVPEGGYEGAYLIILAQQLYNEHGNALLDQPTIFFTTYAETKLLDQIKKTLKDYGIDFNIWFSEKKLHQSSAIQQALNSLKEKGHLFEQDGALWFQSTSFGDDKDRVVKKASGALTYAAADIAYMQDKLKRGAQQLIYILGHDHHSYANRLDAMLKALQLESHPLDVILYQLVKLKQSNNQVRMSKRKGKIVTLQDVIDTVGKDVARFFYLNRKADGQLEFDIDLALKNTEENPVYYIQYAYVRTKSILNKSTQHHQLQDINCDDLKELTDMEHLIIKKIASFKDVLMSIERTHQTHLVAYYSLELAQLFNKFYHKQRVIDLESIAKSRARLAIVTLVQNSLALCLELMGLSKPEKM